MAIDGETVADFIFLVSKITEDGEWAMKLIDTYSLEEKKQRYYFANKGLSSQGYGFSSSRVCESWTIKKAEHWRIDTFELWCWRRLWESLGLQGDPTSPS